jgi:hypothetical protein
VLAVLVANLFLASHVAAAGIALTSQHLTTTATCALVSYPATSLIGVDAWVEQQHSARNNGTGTTLTISSFGTNTDRADVQFDLTRCAFAPPTGAIVRSATVRLFESALPAACETYDIFRNTASWTETGVTWATQPAPATTTINQPAGTLATSKSATVGTPGTCGIHAANSYVTWDVTSDVSAFLAGTATNNGWMIRDDVEGQGSAETLTLAARELGTLADAPQLLVTYTLV